MATRAALLLAGVTFSLGSASLAQDIDPSATEEAARAALAVLGIAATPNETLSSFSFLNITGDASDFRSTQLRWGGPILEDNRLYYEGLVAYQVYNPVEFFPEISEDTSVDVRWSSAAATFGLGRDFRLVRDWVFRPMAHVSLGYVTTEALLDGIPLFADSNSVDRGLSAGGAGASLSLFRETQSGLWDGEYRLRHTYLEFFPINEANAGNAHANAHQTTAFTRHRYPFAHLDFIDTTLKSVFDAGVIFYHGDGATVLRTDWLATLGIGLELDVSQSNAPFISAGRIMLNGVVGEDFSGFSLGFGLSF